MNIVTVLDQDGLTALMVAAGEGKRECLSVLLAHGPDVNKADKVSAVNAYHIVFSIGYVVCCVVWYCGVLYLTL